MVCYACGGNTAVLNSRLQKRRNQVWRRRQCLLCDTLFTTEETLDYTRALQVSAAPKKLAAFERDRLFLSIYKVLGHRPTALADAGSLADGLCVRLARPAKGAVIRTQQITQMTLVTLNRFDKLAAQLYSATHRG